MPSTTATKTPKTSKKQAIEAYDSFFYTLQFFQGATSEEQKRMAFSTLKDLRTKAAKVAELVKNPGTHFRNDAWLWEACSVTIPERLASFEAKWKDAQAPAPLAGLVSQVAPQAEPLPANVIVVNFR